MNSLAPKVRHFSKVLGYQLPISSKTWRKVDESNATGSSPVLRVQTGLPTIERYLPNFPKLLVGRERVELSCLSAYAPKAYAYPGSATGPHLGEHRGNRTHHYSFAGCRLKPIGLMLRTLIFRVINNNDYRRRGMTVASLNSLTRARATGHWRMLEMYCVPCLDFTLRSLHCQ